MRPVIPTLRDDADTVTLAQLAADCLTHLASIEGYSPGTLAGYSLTYDQFRAFLGANGKPDVPASFTSDAVMGFVRDLGSRGIKPNTIIGKLSALSTLAQYAMRRKGPYGRPYLKSNPTKTFEWPKHQEPDTRFLRHDELQAFLDVSVTPRSALIRAVLVDTALRASELCRLNVEDVVEINGKWYVATIVKGIGTRRRTLHVPLSPPVVESIRGALLARGLPPGDAPLLVGRTGDRLTRSALGHLVARIAVDAGITRHASVGPHTIRHTVLAGRRFSGVARPPA